jgi:hypothetical protein
MSTFCSFNREPGFWAGFGWRMFDTVLARFRQFGLFSKSTCHHPIWFFAVPANRMNALSHAGNPGLVNLSHLPQEQFRLRLVLCWLTGGSLAGHSDQANCLHHIPALLVFVSVPLELTSEEPCTSAVVGGKGAIL